jgi:chromate reductase, NAD(P)H dehydrogenase (quinone)
MEAQANFCIMTNFKSAALTKIWRISLGKKFKILAFAGSLRKNSYNKALIHAAVELAPENVLIEVFDLEGIPLYNDDNLNNPHPKVVKLKQKIQDVDALLISSPEYNYSIPGVLKNAIDCASRV